MLFVCEKHMKEALKLVELPNIQKVSNGVTCSFCIEASSILMKIAYKPNPIKKKTCGNCVKCSCLIAN
jgi:hypothetical protein